MEALLVTFAALVGLYSAIVPTDDSVQGSLVDLKENKDVLKHYPLRPHSQFAPLSHGNTHYWITGDPLAKHKIVLLHGISGSWASMPHVVDGLSRRGFQVLSYDIYGRGYSASPGVKYSTDLYVKQLKELMDHAGWERANVLGYSMGGGIAASFADQYVEKVNDLVLVAPSGLREGIPFGARVLAFPFLGPLFSYTLGRRLLSRLSNSNHSRAFINSPHMTHFSAVQDLNIKLNPGFLRAYLGTVQKGGPIEGLRAVYQRVGMRLGNRVFCIWGKQDQVVSFTEDAPIFQALNPKANFVAVDGGHSVFPEQCDLILDPVTQFLKRNS
ncbi:Alpha/Beta hydrolase protein [Obelidium mucronatum]|nr:Alpha/Beta hydrolase protein [Obelidium mucronatum]